MILSVTSVPTQLARSLDLCFQVIKDAAGIHFYTGDDAVASQPSKNNSYQPMLAVLNERDSRLKYHVSDISFFVSLAGINCPQADVRLEQTGKMFSSSPLRTDPNLQSSLCTFLI